LSFPASNPALEAGSSIAADEPTITQAWDEALRRTILAQALETLRTTSKIGPTSLRLFELIALRGVPLPAAAVQCGVSANDAYVIKHRVASRLRIIMQDLVRGYEVL